VSPIGTPLLICINLRNAFYQKWVDMGHQVHSAATFFSSCCVYVTGNEDSTKVVEQPAELAAESQALKVRSVLYFTIIGLLFVILRERLRSIVKSMSVSVFVCPRGCFRNHTRDLYQFFVRVAYVRSSVLLRQVDDRPHRLSAERR